VAVKCFENLTALTTKEVRAIEREARIMRKARNAHIIDFIGFSLERGLIVTELALCSLHDVLHREGYIPREMVLATSLKMSWFQCIADGLKYLHFHGILHRDLKPQNVLLVRSDTADNAAFAVKISDFGISAAVGMSTLGTTKDAAVGTVSYMAPELLDFEGSCPVYTTAVDMYAFGVLMNETMSGMVPWEGLKPIAISKALDKGKRPTLFTANSAPEEQLRAIIIGDVEKGCAAASRHTAADVQEMLHALVTLPSADISKVNYCFDLPCPWFANLSSCDVEQTGSLARAAEEARIAAEKKREEEAAAETSRAEEARIAADKKQEEDDAAETKRAEEAAAEAKRREDAKPAICPHCRSKKEAVYHEFNKDNAWYICPDCRKSPDPDGNGPECTVS
jgi:serine/threonine protein kinase